ncbi:hypothetical protein HYH02_005653 [Chlamydomonas schloesseri]|uniref:Uncharacterized protein n=1 Tax=Chlamydomonas schloesseri TaxID=2026947 RepID=A0A835WLN4_9CHLO|nr:hypothetical protein HYH02_005653 [Chlamydomonas schloesseri]|eukprot:KAG2449509.1 hypothetical protein HYH02_005653 [Chlamydomonas schloesseri]
MAHKPLDYSKWDNIDTDSDSDDGGAPAPRRAAPAPAAGTTSVPAPPEEERVFERIPAGAAVSILGPAFREGRPANVTQPGIYRQEAVRPLPSSARPASLPDAPVPGQVVCTYAPCAGDTSCRFFRNTSLPREHPAFTQGVASPVAALVGLPLLVFRLDARPSLSIPRSATYDNQGVTYMMIEPRTGFAAPVWQQGVGSAVVVRADKKPLPRQHVEAFWEFCTHLLDRFGDGDTPDPAEDMTPAAWQMFFDMYQADNAERRKEWREVWRPWEAPPPPDVD